MKSGMVVGKKMLLTIDDRNVTYIDSTGKIQTISKEMLNLSIAIDKAGASFDKSLKEFSVSLADIFIMMSNTKK